jgi:5-methylcytosine-specific restriction endonuclease McrA
VHTSKMALKVPRVMVLQMFDKLPRTRVRFSRQNIYTRDGYVCQYCGDKLPRSKLNLDHVLPKSQGGKTNWTNIVCACVKCNSTKANRTPEQAGMKLLRQPKKPSWSQLTPTSKLGHVPYQEWAPFVDVVSAAYWNTELQED